jgi:hypothetical protein
VRRFGGGAGAIVELVVVRGVVVGDIVDIVVGVLGGGSGVRAGGGQDARLFTFGTGV